MGALKMKTNRRVVDRGGSRVAEMTCRGGHQRFDEVLCRSCGPWDTADVMSALPKVGVSRTRFSCSKSIGYGGARLGRASWGAGGSGDRRRLIDLKIPDFAAEPAYPTARVRRVHSQGRWHAVRGTDLETYQYRLLGTTVRRCTSRPLLRVTGVREPQRLGPRSPASIFPSGRGATRW